MPMGNTLKLEDLLKPDCVPDESAGGENWRILHGDTLKLVKGFQPGIFDAVITDPPYASGGTKQNERNRTTNQKYSSMKAENALPDLMGIIKTSVPGPTGWQNGCTMCGKPAREGLRSASLLTGDSTRPSPMPSSGQGGSGEGLPSGTRGTPVRRKADSASRQNILYGEATDRCRSTARCPAFRVCFVMEIPRTASM